MQVVELRNYLLADGAKADFIRYFEEHFLFSQRDEGMHPLGQFEVVGAPNRFVWMRGFLDMPARFRGLTRFYGGAFWLARRDLANAMMREHHDVHLLRPLESIDTLTGGLSLEDRASEPPGIPRPDTGLVVVDFYRRRGPSTAWSPSSRSRCGRRSSRVGIRCSGTSSPSSPPTTIRGFRWCRIPRSSSSSPPTGTTPTTPV